MNKLTRYFIMTMTLAVTASYGGGWYDYWFSGEEVDINTDAGWTNQSGGTPRIGRSEGLLRLYLMESTRAKLSPETKAGIEDYALHCVKEGSNEIILFWNHTGSENHYLNGRRRTTMALQIVRMAERYGPNLTVKGTSIEERYQAWIAWWKIHIRRDVYYTPDYTMSTISYDPARFYETIISIKQSMGVICSSDRLERIAVMGNIGGRRAVNGITGKAVSIIARDPNAVFGTGRFTSNGNKAVVSYPGYEDLVLDFSVKNPRTN